MKCWFIVCLVLIGCGEEQDTNEPVEPYECINCDIEPPVNEEEDIVYEPRPYMYFFPPGLMFYYESTTEHPYPPQTIMVCNATEEVVTIIDAYIAGVEYAYGGDDSYYFFLSTVEPPRGLSVGECLPMEVSFRYSQRQRWAQLIVHTTFESYAEMAASLSGKVFSF